MMVEVPHTIAMDRWLFMICKMTFLLHQQTLHVYIKPSLYAICKKITDVFYVSFDFTTVARIQIVLLHVSS